MDGLEPIQSAPYSRALDHGIGNKLNIVLVPSDPAMNAYQMDTEARGVYSSPSCAIRKLRATTHPAEPPVNDSNLAETGVAYQLRRAGR